MVNFHKSIVGALKSILPTYYEMILNRELSIPCISYMELSNASRETGETIGYSAIQYQIKVWANKIEDLQNYASQIDNALRPLGWKRVGSNELFDTASTMMQKILVYEATALETFE